MILINGEEAYAHQSKSGKWDYHISTLELVLLKNNKPGKRVRFCLRPYTPINYCELCGKFGSPRKVTVRNDVYRWNVLDKSNDFTTPSKDMLCVGCWNKARAFLNRHSEVLENNYLLNKLKRSISDERKQKNQNNG